MIESICEAISLIVVTGCFVLSLVRAQRTRSAAWLTIALFYGCMSLGDAYWSGYLAVFGATPQYSYISELSWVAAYLFLLMVQIEGDKSRAIAAFTPAALVPVAVCVGCGIYFIATHGSPLLNIADEGLLSAVGFFAVRGLLAAPSDAGRATTTSGTPPRGLAYNRRFHAAVLAFVLIEQAVWVSSCFLEPGIIATVNAYIIASYGLTASTAAILVCAWKSDAL